MKLTILLFVVSQLAHILANAFAAAANVNTKWDSTFHYLQTNASKLLTQLVLSVGIFMVLMENPALLDKLNLGVLATFFTMHGYGTALILGWFFDSILEKVLVLWGLKSPVKPQ